MGIVKVTNAAKRSIEGRLLRCMESVLSKVLQSLFGPLRAFVHRLPQPLAIRLRENIPDGLRERVSHIVRSRADELAALLRGGYSVVATAELEKLAAEKNSQEAPRALWVLAAWNYGEGNFASALEYVNAIPAAAGVQEQLKIILKTECLRLTNQVEKAVATIEYEMKEHGAVPEFTLIWANLLQHMQNDFSKDWFAHVNQIYSAAGIATLAPMTSGARPCLEKMATNYSPICVPSEKPLISILMPVFRPGPEIGYAIRSLLEQSWSNIEILIIDDGSNDLSVDLLRSIAATDNRIRVIFQKQNTGSYGARNFGLRYATGHFVTVHDADDWSHPEKLALQAQHLLSNPNVVANATTLVRCDANCVFILPKRPHAGIIRMNHSSVMISRKRLEEIGGWDEVRVSSDTELVNRLRRKYGKSSVQTIYSKTPLAFALTTETSLTGSHRTSLETLYHGVRHEYHKSAAHWLQSVDSPVIKPNRNGVRPFPAPGFILPQKTDLAVDIALVMDASADTDSYPLLTWMLDQNIPIRLGIFHWQVFEENTKTDLRELHHSFRELSAKRIISVICPGEFVTATTLIGADIRVFRNPIDLPPQVSCSRFLILEGNQAEKELPVFSTLISNCAPELISWNELIKALSWHPDHSDSNDKLEENHVR